MIYYVDSQFGNDRNDGLSRQTAFRSLKRANELVLKGGDTLLLKAGVEYEGPLQLRRAEDGGVIRVDRYGVGAKPLIRGNGHPPVRLVDFDPFELQNVAVTNPLGEMGIQVLNRRAGAHHHVYVRRCDVSHVNERRGKFVHECGGILLCAWSEEPSWFEDALIEDNKIEDVSRTGIMLASPWVVRPDWLWGKNKYISDEDGWFPSKKFVVRGNYMNRLGGDGILLEGTDKGLMEWNTVHHLMTDPVAPCANAGIWPVNSNDCLIQYNEVGYSHKPDGCDDAQGFDVDLSCKNTIVQYNYSHDNGGGFLLLCEVFGCGDCGFEGTVVRNNLSVNDGAVKGETIAIVGPVRGALIENNTLIPAKEVDRVLEVFSPDGEDQAKRVTFRNNLIYTPGEAEGTTRHNLWNGEDFVLENNLYWGKEHIPAPQETNAVMENPAFVPAEGGIGRLVGAAFVPAAASPAMEKGAAPLSPATEDFFGTPTDEKSYIGAFVPKA